MTKLPGALVTLGLRRTLSITVVVSLVVVLSLALLQDPMPGWSHTTEVDALRRIALERHGLWSAFFFAMLPILVWQAATLGDRWRRRDRNWLGVLPWSRAALGFSSALGVLIAALAASGFAWLGASFGVEASSPPRLIHTFQHDALLLPEMPEDGGGTSLTRVSLTGETDSIDAVQVTPSVAPGSGPAVDLELALVAADGSRTETGLRLFARTPVRLEAPGAGPWTLELQRARGAVVFLPRSSVHALSDAGSSATDLGFFARCASGLASWALLALGLGAWMRLSLAIGTCLSLSLVPWAFGEMEGVGSLFPAGDFGTSLTLLAEGIAPGPLPWGSWLAPFVLLLASTWMLRAALVRGGLS